MSTRFFDGFDALARVFEKMAIEEHAVVSESIGAAAHLVKRHVDETFGDKTKLAALSEYTVQDRVALGYSPDEPLLRSGELLKDHVEVEHHGLESGVGSAEPVQLYSELGFVSRSGTSVPPRPVFKIGLEESVPEIAAAIDVAVDVLISGRIKPRATEE